MTRVGFVGPGRMGRPMVDRLLAAGHEVTVLARRAEVRDEVARAGATAVASAGEAAEGADVVLACLFSDAQLLEVADDLIGALAPGAVLASHVTGSRTTVLELEARARARGATVVDAPVSGGEAEIRAGRLTILLGGDDGPVAAVDAVVAAYGDPRIRTGPLGSALAAKLVNNLLFAAHVQTAASAIALGRQLGLSQQKLVEVLASSSGSSYVTGRIATRPVATWAEGVGEFLRKDVAACRSDLEREGHDPGFLERVVHDGPLPIAAGG